MFRLVLRRCRRRLRARIALGELDPSVQIVVIAANRSQNGPSVGRILNTCLEQIAIRNAGQFLVAVLPDFGQEGQTVYDAVLEELIAQDRVDRGAVLGDFDGLVVQQLLVLEQPKVRLFALLLAFDYFERVEKL